MKRPVGFGAVHSSSQYGECAKLYFWSVLFVHYLLSVVSLPFSAIKQFNIPHSEVRARVYYIFFLFRILLPFYFMLHIKHHDDAHEVWFLPRHPLVRRQFD